VTFQRPPQAVRSPTPLKGLRFLYQLRPAIGANSPTRVRANRRNTLLVSKPLSPKSHYQGGQCGDCGRQGVEPGC
jgi:hypothetical protein